MHYSEFMKNVRSHANLSDEPHTIDAVKATFETLAERLKGGEPHHLASQLPHEVAGYLHHDGKGERFSVEEFYRRICEREHVDMDQAKMHARAVLETVCQAVDKGEMDDVYRQLPDEFKALFGWH